MASTTTALNELKPTVNTHDDTPESIHDAKQPTGEEDATGKIFSIDTMDLPNGYYHSPFFIGSMFAIGMSIMCGVAGFSFIAPLLSFVNADIGPSADITWVALTYTLTGAVGLMIVGRLTGSFNNSLMSIFRC